MWHTRTSGMRLYCAGIEGFTNVAHTHIEAALPVLKRNGVPMLVHAEVVDEREPQVRPYSWHAQPGLSSSVFLLAHLLSHFLSSCWSLYFGMCSFVDYSQLICNESDTRQSDGNCYKAFR